MSSSNVKSTTLFSLNTKCPFQFSGLFLEGPLRVFLSPVPPFVSRRPSDTTFLPVESPTPSLILPPSRVPVPLSRFTYSPLSRVHVPYTSLRRLRFNPEEPSFLLCVFSFTLPRFLVVTPLPRFEGSSVHHSGLSSGTKNLLVFLLTNVDVTKNN